MVKKQILFRSLKVNRDSSGYSKKHAQAFLEFALVLPVLLLLLFGIFEFARVFQSWLVVTNSARIGVRYAVTGAYEPHFCTAAIDSNGNGLVCGAEPDKDARIIEEDAARLLSIYEVTTNSAAGILRDSTVISKTTPGYFHVTVCTSSGGHVYHPLPDDYCSPSDHPGDPSHGPARVLVSVTYEHPIILPLIVNFAPSVTLHAERTGILEQFRVARVLGLPPNINLPTATPAPTATPVPTATSSPTPTPDCSLYSLSDASIEQYNHYRINVNNASTQDVRVTFIGLNWDEAEIWSEALGYHNLRVDYFNWDGDKFYNGDDYSSPTNISANLLLSAGTSGYFVSDFDYSGEESNGFTNWGLTPDNFGVTVHLDNGCSYFIEPQPNPLPTPNCDLYSIYPTGFFDSNGYAIIYLNAKNEDAIGTKLSSVQLNWDYAEGMDELKDSDDELNVDWIRFGTSFYGNMAWGDGNGNARDYNSTTNTNSDSSQTWTGPLYFDTNKEYYVTVDFDNQWGDFYDDLVPEDFGMTLNFENGCVLNWTNIPRPLPTPDCSLYSVDDFYYNSRWNHIKTSVTNGDVLDTKVSRIVLDWDYADQVSELILGDNSLFADWFTWRGSYIWSRDGDPVGDHASKTDTDADNPEAWTGPRDFLAGSTNPFEVDFDFSGEYRWAFRDWWDVHPDDFGATFYFENGCILDKPAIPRPIGTPTPDCSELYVTDVRFNGDDFEVRVRNNNLADAYFTDSILYWPDNTGSGSYVNYMRFNYTHYYDTDTYNSPVSAAPTSPGMLLPGRTRYWWETDFNHGLPYGHYQGILTFNYPDWGICTVEASLDRIAPTYTPTINPNATDTPVPTLTPTRTLRPTATNTPTPSITPIPTNTNTPTRTPTRTEPPIPTDTTQPPPPTSTEPPEPTNTYAPPTDTQVPTDTPVATPTPTIPGGG